ncbi:MAG TPA: chloride channel protein [Gemmatimonadales bacterium]|nr:chloride channel protein [Gemmatimonadales bacterium]
MPPRDSQPTAVPGPGHPAGGLPVAPSLAPAVEALRLPGSRGPDRHRIFVLSGAAILTAFLASATAELLVALIGLITNVSFYGRVSTAFSSPAGNTLGLVVIAVPIIGAVVVGLMARWGSPAIRGHGIPEAMEQVLLNQSRISPRVTLLKPLSAAVSIGTGGPFGAEGPIIATGGALGSLLGQLGRTTADERKILLSAGAAAGMTAIFGTPVSAVLLAIELLLFEYRPRSLVPVALAASVSAAVRIALHGPAPVFPMPQIAQPGGWALTLYVLLGAVIGLAAVYITRLLYAIEDGFEHLGVHWMWWPAIGAVAVGIIGYVSPRTLGVGYENIDQIVNGTLTGRVLLVLVILKAISWLIALGSGTSGGTLAPLFTVGGGIGALLGGLVAAWLPHVGFDPRVAGLVGMAAMFAGASHALLASVVFAFETTRQPIGLLPLLAGCTAAYLVSLRLMRYSIMTEKLARRGTPVRTEYTLDYLGRVLVREVAPTDVVTLDGDETIGRLRLWLNGAGAGATHQGFPVLDDKGELIGVVTRRDVLDPAADEAQPVRTLVKRAPVVIFDDNTLREAADQMVREHVGRLPVVQRHAPRHVVGIMTRSDLLEAHASRLAASAVAERSLSIPWPERRKAARA